MKDERFTCGTLILFGALLFFAAAPVSAQVASDVEADPAEVETATERAESEPDPELVKRVHVLLAGIEFEPTAEQFKALGPEASKVLHAVARDAERTPVERGRAVVALVHFEDARSGDVLTKLLDASATPRHLKRKIIWTLGRIGDSDSVEHLKPYLANKDYATREATIDSLGRMGGEKAREALRSHVDRESSEHLKKKLKAALANPSPSDGVSR